MLWPFILLPPFRINFTTIYQGTEDRSSQEKPQNLLFQHNQLIPLPYFAKYPSSLSPFPILEFYHAASGLFQWFLIDLSPGLCSASILAPPTHSPQSQKMSFTKLKFDDSILYLISLKCIAFLKISTFLVNSKTLLTIPILTNWSLLTPFPLHGSPPFFLITL